ncbi:MAG: ABC transporter permease [Burkholderiales bacterium]|nr:ABC transporter permease [Burkholderiales bacterium]
MASSAAPLTSANRPPALWPWALRQLWRDWRAGELRLLLLAVTLAVAALTAVSFFVDRLDRGLQRDAAQLLGGDGVIASDQPLPPVFIDEARKRGLALTRMAAFPSMARSPDERGGATRLVSLKAVDGAYPLRGRMVVSDAVEDGQPGAHERRLASGPPRGEVWADAGVLRALELRVGDTLLLGDASLRIGARIVTEPDRGAGFMAFAPRVLMHADDLPATALIQPASRVTWRLAVAAPRPDDPNAQAAVHRYMAWAAATIEQQRLRGVRVDTLESGRPETQQTLARAEQFLKLVALLAALLAAIAVAIAARDFALRRLDACAVLRVLGEPQRRIAGGYAIGFMVAGTLASVAGVALGLLLNQVFVALLGDLVGTRLPSPGLWPALFGLAVGWVLCLGFGLPPVLQLARVPALRVIRRDVGEPRAASLGVTLGGLAGFGVLLWSVAAEPRLGSYAVGGFAAAAAVFALGAWAAIAVLRRLLATPLAARWPSWLRLATRQVAARPALGLVQVTAMGLGLFALLLLTLLRTDLIDSWRQATPADAPNRFVINIQPDQAADFQRVLGEQGVARYDWYPMVRGRLVAINGQPVQAARFEDERTQRLVEREFNLSHAGQPPAHNPIVAGRWQPEERDALSVEAGLAQRLGLKLGDRLRFDVAGQVMEGRITSLRQVDWASMRVNFFVMFPLAELPAGVPKTYISAFRTPGGLLDRVLGHDFPNLTVVDVTAQIAQVQGVMNQVIRAVEFLFVFTLAAGLAVLVAALLASRESRTREFAVLRALGAGNRLLSRVQAAELLGLGALAGALAGVASLAVGWVLSDRVFDFPWQAPLWWPLVGAAVGAVLAWAVGWWGLRDVLRRPAGQSLREAV